MTVVHPHPSPPWGRGWRATGILISRGAPGEGVPNPDLFHDQAPLRVVPARVHRRTHSKRRGASSNSIRYAVSALVVDTA
jgi:hypothetical protein